MAAVRCPKCGAINYEGIASFPRCRRCREHLLRCRYCAHFDRRILDCVHPLLREGSHINDPDLYAACRQHKTILRVGAAGKAVALFTSPPVLTALVLAVVIAVGGYTFGYYYKRSNVVMPPQLTLTASLYPERASVGQMVWLKANITNVGSVPGEHVTLYVGRAFTENLEPVDLAPVPEVSASDPGWERLDFGRLGPGAGIVVRYSFQTKEAGVFPLRLQLRSAGMAHRTMKFELPVTE